MAIITTIAQWAVHPTPRLQVLSSDRIISVDGFEGSGAALMDKARAGSPP